MASVCCPLTGECGRTFYHAIQTGTSFQAVAVYVGLTASFVGTILVVSLCATARDTLPVVRLSVDIDEGKKGEVLLRRSEAHLAEAQSLSHSGASAYNDQRFSIGRRRLTASGGLIRATASEP